MKLDVTTIITIVAIALFLGNLLSALVHKPTIIVDTHQHRGTGCLLPLMGIILLLTAVIGILIIWPRGTTTPAPVPPEKHQQADPQQVGGRRINQAPGGAGGSDTQTNSQPKSSSWLDKIADFFMLEKKGSNWQWVLHLKRFDTEKAARRFQAAYTSSAEPIKVGITEGGEIWTYIVVATHDEGHQKMLKWQDMASSLSLNLKVQTRDIQKMK